MVPAVLPLLVLTASTTYELGARTEVRGSPQGGGEMQVNPALLVKTPFGHVSLLASYTPRILLFEPQPAKRVSLFHRARLMGEWRYERSGRLSLDQQASYGDGSFSWLAIAAEGGQPSFDRLAELSPLRYFSESTALGLWQALSRKLGLSATAAYTVSGGVGAAARSSLPLQYGPRVGLSLAWSMGAYDSLLATTMASEQRFSTGAHSYIVETHGSWRHKLSQRTQFDVALGAGWGRDVETGTRKGQVYPFVEMGLRRELLAKRSHDLGGRLRAGVGPAVDPLTGAVYARAQGFATVDYFPMPKLDLAAGGGTAIGLSAPLRGQRLGFGGISASYELNRHFAFTGGARVLALPNVQWVGFVAFAVADRGRLAPAWEL